MSQAPSMPMYWDAYLADTTHLTTEEHGAYLLLLGAMWRRNGSVPDDDRDNARILGLTPAKWRRIKARFIDTISGFRVEDGTITQEKLQKTWKNTQEKIGKNRENGAKGGRPKSNENNDLGKANGSVSVNPNKSIPEPEPEPIKSIDQSAPDPCFDEFWKEWPLGRVGKQKAKAAFNRLSQQNQKIATERVKEWARGWRTKYPQASDIHPTSYLNGKRWEDEFNTSTPDQSAKVDRWRKLAGG